MFEAASRYHQSRGVFNLSRVGVSSRLKQYDWFHSLIHYDTAYILLLVVSVYTFFFILYAPLYLAISKSCGLQLRSFRDALYLSVETMVTIGYGVPDPYFNGCGSGLVILITQSLIGFILDACLFGIVFTRIARGQRRASSILFSNTAIIREHKGKYYFMFQVAEMRKHQLCEASVRLYAIRSIRDTVTGQSVHFQTCAMRLTHPNDELGSNLMLAIPATVVHEIDTSSPLYPIALANRMPHKTPMNSHSFPSVLVRDQDTATGSRDAAPCLACGEVFLSEEILRRHIAYSMADDRVSGHATSTACSVCGEAFPSALHLQRHVEYSHTDKEREAAVPLDQESVSVLSHVEVYGMSSLEEESEDPRALGGAISDFINTTHLEVLCILEAIDGTTSGSLQARHSYTSDDLVWDHAFAQCVFTGTDGSCIVDFHKFHNTLPKVQGRELLLSQSYA